MRKLKLQTQISIDGFIAGPNGEMDWMVWNWDDALKQYVMDITKPVDTILLGRVLAQGFINHWATLAKDPASSEEFAWKMHESHKVVFTSTLEDVGDWEYTSLAKGDLVEEVNALKNQEGQDIIVYGGGKFVTSLIKHGLIDEYHLFVNPSALGSGMPIFQGLEKRAGFKLVDAKPFECGIVVLQYRSEK
jgi:dihydrofolate reductase